MADENNDGLEEESESKASVGDIFGVSAGKKKKKKKKKKEEEAVAAADDDDTAADDDDAVPFPDEEDGESEAEEDPEAEVSAEPEETSEPAKAKKSPKAAKTAKEKGLDGVLLPSSEPAPAVDDDAYLGASDLGDYEAPKSKAVPMLVAIIVALVVVILGGAVYFGGLGGDLVALFKGELREKRISEARMEEEQFKKEQLENLDRFGNLMISGNPQYALVKLNGQLQYGKTSQGWREVRVGTTAGVQDLKIKEKHRVEFSAPGYEPKTVEITEGMWEENPGAGYVYSVTPSLLPVSIQAKREFDARLSEDVDNEFYGAITINTIPSGAKVIFNNKPLLDENGEELTTPVTFDKYYVKDEESGKLEEKEVRVDTALDVGHKIQLQMEYESNCPEPKPGVPIKCGESNGCCPAECTVADDPDCKWPAYVSSLTRPMWTCTWNTDDGLPPDDVPKGKTIQHFCDYSFTLDLDFNSLKNYIIAREEERKRIKEQYKAAQADAGTEGEASETAQAP